MTEGEDMWREDYSPMKKGLKAPHISTWTRQKAQMDHISIGWRDKVNGVDEGDKALAGF